MLRNLQGNNIITRLIRAVQAPMGYCVGRRSVGVWEHTWNYVHVHVITCQLIDPLQQLILIYLWLYVAWFHLVTLWHGRTFDFIDALCRISSAKANNQRCGFRLVSIIFGILVEILFCTTMITSMTEPTRYYRHTDQWYRMFPVNTYIDKSRKVNSGANACIAWPVQGNDRCKPCCIYK